LKNCFALRYCIVLIILCVWLGKNVYASQPIKYLGIENGLSNNAVTCITQDRYGFIWMGTYDGLNRYDGYQFKIFRNLWGDKKSLVNNHIKTITAIDKRIFVGTEKGVMYYDYSDSEFHSLYYLQRETHKVTKVSCVINQIVTDNSGNIYIATDDLGMLRFEKSDTVGRQISYKNKSSAVQAIAIDKLNQVWLVINGTGLCSYSASNDKVTLANNALISANCLLSDKNNQIWIGTNNGLFTYTPSSGQLVKFDETHAKLTSDNIFNLALTHEQEIWISTNGNGINIWNGHTEKLSYLKPGETGNFLRSGAVAAVYEDKEKRKWIATLRGGVNIIDNKSIPFHLFTHDVLNKNSVINNFILSFCEDEKNNIWIGTDGGGMSYWNTKSNAFTSYVHQPGPGNLSSNFVVSMVNDYANKLWVATFSGGIDAFDKATGRFKHYPCYNPITKAEEKNFWKLYEDHQHRLWASATWNGALYLLNRTQDRFELFDKNLINLHTLYQDHKGTLWAGDYTRLIKIDIESKKFRYFYIGQPIRSIIEDNRGNFWIGTEGGGLILYNTVTNTYKRYTEVNGLPSNSILNILIDDNDNLWCSTYNGLSNFNVKTGKFTNYNSADGLQSNQFNYNAALKLSNGQMLFGGLKGFNMFYPDSVKSYVHEPALLLTDFKVNNTSIDNNFDYSHHQPVYELKQITIPFSQATIAINYTALEYSFPEKISYAYYLEGWDHHWNYVGKLKQAYYTRLNEGHYTLKIKATNTEGTWNQEPLTILLTVLPPWYRTWWAYLLYLSAISVTVYWFWLYRIRQTKLKYEVQIANLKVEREKEINEKKLAFFTNVSHEFRTPLTLIINPIKDLLNQSKENKEELNIVYRNAKRLIGLVDHLLLFRKTESENTTLNLTKVNFTDMCKDVYTCFTHQAKIKQVNYRFESAGAINLYVDREKIEIALFNLISNAIKFTPVGGSIYICIREDEHSVYFEIADTGVGINADVGEKLFDKFYQVKDANSLKTGFGIGLYLVKTFIESHDGTITYKSTLGGGTTFILSIPKVVGDLDTSVAEPVNEISSYAEDHITFDYDENVAPDPVTDLELLISDHQSILVIDDNPEIRNYIKRIFAADYTIFEAADGQLGLEIIKKHLPDIIISDIVMPNLSGLELCRIIKQDSALSHIPIILLTGESTPDIRLQGIEEGAVDFLSKPFDKDLLVARVKGIIKNKRELQSYFYNEITLKSDKQNISEEHKAFLYKLIDIIEGSLMNPELEVSIIAEKMGMSHSNLYKKIKQMTGQSLNGFIRFIRLRKAAEVMINTNCNVNEAAFRVGFNDVKYFREHFHKQFGLNPSEFIKRHRVAFQKSYTLNKKDKH
jgi:signal transduction histidine kinase/ligand-binding sensor domain-containing protein/DNA-binding NarL/FixJ family response regulator